MKLSVGLQVKSGSTVTFVGAGGKTTAMRRLGSELAATGMRVIATTTTRLGLNQLDLFPSYLVDPTPENLKTTLDKENYLLIVRALDEANAKALGFLPEQIYEFNRMADVVLVEGDGSRGLSMKAPGSGEPVIPPQTTHLVSMLNLKALGKPLDSDTVHRPEIVATLTGTNLGEVITSNVMVRLLLHAQGPARGAPPGARHHVVLNGFDHLITDQERTQVESLAARLSADPAVASVLLGQVAHEPPLVASYGKTAAVVLAAGSASRFGSSKQLFDWHGKPLLQHVVERVLTAPAQEVFVVLGAQFEEISKTLHGLPVTLIYNEDWERGQSASIQAGLRVCTADTQAVIFILGDQPFLPAELPGRMLEVHRRTLAPIVAPRHQNRRGNPVLFNRRCFPELMQLSGDTGGRGLIQKYEHLIEWVETGPEILFDIDTPEDVSRAIFRKE